MQVRFYLSQYEAENYVIRALYTGCPEEKTLTTLDDYQPSDVAVVMGVFKKNIPASFKRGHVIHEQNKRGLNNLILETGYVNRGDGPFNHYALGWNGLNGRADFRNKGMPADRAGKLPVKLQPWKASGDYILVCGQVPWDASCDFIDYEQWLGFILGVCKSSTDKRIILRPHPKCGLSLVEWKDRSTIRSIEEDVKDAHCVVSFNSNSGVDAVIAGTPNIVFDRGAMAYEVSHNKDVIDFDKLPRPDRTQWFNNLAYAQWTSSEMRSGEAWNHISRTNSTKQ